MVELSTMGHPDYRKLLKATLISVKKTVTYNQTYDKEAT